MPAHDEGKEYKCDLCGAPVHREDVITRVAEAPFGLCCHECRGHNLHQHHLRLESIQTGFHKESTRVLSAAVRDEAASYRNRKPYRPSSILLLKKGRPLSAGFEKESNGDGRASEHDIGAAGNPCGFCRRWD